MECAVVCSDDLQDLHLVSSATEETLLSTLLSTPILRLFAGCSMVDSDREEEEDINRACRK